MSEGMVLDKVLGNSLLSCTYSWSGLAAVQLMMQCFLDLDLDYLHRVRSTSSLIN
jgi:hypothetical protein